MNQDMLKYYASGVEATRLESDPLERIRTQEIISGYLHKAPMKILDAGGGAGVYSYWLKQMGHEVHLLDPSPVNIENTKKKGEELGLKLDGIHQGFAQQLVFADDFFDMVLLFGPLYHLIEREERIKTIKESKRVLKANGRIFAATISRFASMLDGFSKNLIADEAFVSIMKQDLINGQHRNPTDNFQYFTTAFFHHPKEIKEEMRESGFDEVQVLPVESFAWLMNDINEKWKDEKFRELLLETIRTVEKEETILGISAHHVTVAIKR